MRRELPSRLCVVVRLTESNSGQYFGATMLLDPDFRSFLKLVHWLAPGQKKYTHQ